MAVYLWVIVHLEDSFAPKLELPGWCLEMLLILFRHNVLSSSCYIFCEPTTHNLTLPPPYLTVGSVFSGWLCTVTVLSQFLITLFTSGNIQPSTVHNLIKKFRETGGGCRGDKSHICVWSLDLQAALHWKQAWFSTGHHWRGSVTLPEITVCEHSSLCNP